MADALESSGDELQRKLAMLGRRLTTLRVREMQISRQVTAQDAELKGLRGERAERHKETREAAVDAAAQLQRAERSKRLLEARLTEATRKLVASVPSEQL